MMRCFLTLSSFFQRKHVGFLFLAPGGVKKVWLSQFKTQHRSIADDLGQLHETSINTNCLVVLTILKYMSSSMGRMTSHMSWKIKFMFQTTNQPKNSPNYIPFALPQRPYLGPSKENNASWTPKKKSSGCPNPGQAANLRVKITVNTWDGKVAAVEKKVKS